MNQNLVSFTSRIDKIIASINNKEFDEEILSHWSRYICILVSGYIEESIKNIVYEYVENKSSPILSNYINNSISKVTNLNCEKIEKILNGFNKVWAEDFKEKVKEEKKTAIDSIVATRNQIAHGKNVSITFPRVKTYYEDVKKSIKIIKSIIS
ncbi:HEPN domain-containing protein [Leptospira sp. GIMC2001]|uniref:HEPN domain-containing protein n=1 Tax=Leptospira sp. GIMC2001 TaxID=1513297 RepID=UPI002348F4F8|nr:HEPN domain-containing protein [Leptospira sp. GIMC2001]WCL51471.1 HEPN domain-containing protein [Leptospira sp. GIMC2001]